MNKSEQIRAMGDAKSRDIAAAVGVSSKYVSDIKWRVKNPDHHSRLCRAANRRWRARNPDHAKALQKQHYHRTKKLGGIGHPQWTPEHTMLLVMLHATGRSFGEIAAEMNISRSTVAGRVHRLRKAGVLT